MTIPHNTMPLRGLPRGLIKFTDMEVVMIREALGRNSPMPAWYYDDSYDEPDPNAPLTMNGCVTRDYTDTSAYTFVDSVDGGRCFDLLSQHVR